MRNGHFALNSVFSPVYLATTLLTCEYNWVKTYKHRHILPAAPVFVRDCSFLQYKRGDHLSGKPGNVRKLYRWQGNVRNLTKCHGNVREKFCRGKLPKNWPPPNDCCRPRLLFTMSIGTCKVLNCYVVEMRTEDCMTFIIFHYSVDVDGTGFYDVISMKSLSLNMNLTVWSLTLTLVVQAWYVYQLKWSGVPQIVRVMSGNYVVSGEWSPCIRFMHIFAWVL